jgi:hypothetical protein
MKTLIRNTKKLLTILIIYTLGSLYVGAAEIEEGDTPSIINAKYSKELTAQASKMTKRLTGWYAYTEERRLYQILQVRVTYASNVGSRLMGMEAIFSQVTEEKPRLYAMRQMYTHYKDAYLALETYYNGTAEIIKMRPELETTASIEVQELISSYALEWVKLRRDAFTAELRKIDPEFNE